MNRKPAFFKRYRALWRRCSGMQKLNLAILSAAVVLFPLAFVGMWITGGFLRPFSWC